MLVNQIRLWWKRAGENVYPFISKVLVIAHVAYQSWHQLLPSPVPLLWQPRFKVVVLSQSDITRPNSPDAFRLKETDTRPSGPERHLGLPEFAFGFEIGAQIGNTPVGHYDYQPGLDPFVSFAGVDPIR